MRELVEKLAGLNRSIVSDALEESLQYIQTRVPLLIHRIPSGSKCFDWTVPRKWIMRGGTIEDEKGNVLIDYEEHNLHVVIGSLPIDRVVTHKELIDHLHWIDDDPDRLPYVFKYYELDWGFCVRGKDLEKFQGKNFHVRIDSDYVDGDLCVGECLIEGEVQDSIAFLSHIDHPVQVQDGLSGVAVLVRVAENLLASLDGHKPYYTYRFFFGPETIGSIAYLASNPVAKNAIREAIFFEMLGVPGQDLVLQVPPQKNSCIAKLFKCSLQRNSSRFSIADPLSVVINDDGVFNSPGVDIPAASLSRSIAKNIYQEHFPGYHTDVDNMNFMDYEKLDESLKIVEYAIGVLEKDCIPVRNYTAIPHLSSHQLWVDRHQYPGISKMIRYLLYNLDNQTSLFEICCRLSIDFDEARLFMERMESKGLVSFKRPQYLSAGEKKIK